MIGMALALGLLLIPLLFVRFAPGSLASVWPGFSLDQPLEEAPTTASELDSAVLPMEPSDLSEAGAPSPELVARATAARLVRLERENAELQDRLASQSARLAASIPASELGAMERELNAVKDLVAQLTTGAKKQESRLAQLSGDLSKARAEAQGAQVEAKRLVAAEATLRKQLEQESAAAKLARAEVAKLQVQLEQLRAGNPEGPMGAYGRKALEELQAKLAAAEKDRDSALSELEQMITKGKPGTSQDMSVPSREEWQRAQEELSAAKDRIRQLEEKLKGQPGARSEVRTDVFRKSSDWKELPAEATRPGDLWIGAMPLFQTLQQSTTAKETVEVRDAYVQSNSLGTLVTRIYFREAASKPDAKAVAELKRAMAQVAPDSYLLAVGYASVEGKSGYNDGLSSKRAQSVVDLVRPLMKGGKVQMVFFGETSQFDSRDLARNRVVELWRVDP